jgi:hypothetical protein
MFNFQPYQRDLNVTLLGTVSPQAHTHMGQISKQADGWSVWLSKSPLNQDRDK